MEKIYITIEDESGEFRPKAILEADNEVGIDLVRNKALKGDKIVRVKIIKIEEICK